MLIGFSLFLTVFISCHVRKAIKVELGVSIAAGQTIEKSLSGENCQFEKLSSAVKQDLKDHKLLPQQISGILLLSSLLFLFVLVDHHLKLAGSYRISQVNQPPLFLLYRKFII